MPTPIVNQATTVWNGDLAQGSGQTSFDTSNVGTFSVNWKARAEVGGGATTPEELIAAAHASCYSMAFSHALGGNGTPPEQLRTTARVTFVAGEGITGIALSVEGEVPGISEEAFLALAEEAKVGCPVSQALKAVDITLSAALV